MSILQQPSDRAPVTIEELHERASQPNARVRSALQSVRGSVLVLGAGGKMGFHLSAMLHRGLREINSPHSVIAVSRFSDPTTTHLFDEYGVTTLSRDLTDRRQLDDLPDADAVFFLAGVKFGTQDDPESLQRMNVDLPQAVANRFDRSRIVGLSTGCVYPYVVTSGAGSRESDTPAPVGAYALSCLGREHALSTSRSPVSLIRLNYSVDLRYGVIMDVGRKVFHDQVVDLTMPCVNIIWQGDANAYIIQSLEHSNQPPLILNVTGAKKLWIRDLANRFAQAFDKPSPQFRGEPAETAWLSDSARCRQLFGEPDIDEEQLFEWAVKWISVGGVSLNKPTHFEVRDGRF